MFRLAPSALEYARKHELHALVITCNGEVVAQAYGDGYEVTTPHALFSGTKSFWGVAALAADREGIIRLDERVADTFTEWEDERWKKRVTLRQLLQLTSGFGFGGLGAAVPTYAKALSVALKHEPGKTFTYSGIPLQVFGAVLARKLESRRQTPHEYLQQRILDPIDMRIDRWRTLADGSHPLPTGAFVSAAEWLKYGQFVGGHHEELRECFRGSAVNPRYGLGFWLETSAAPPDLMYASGAGGQGMYIIPSQQVVIVHFGNSSSFRHEAFLKRLFSSGSRE